jgi:hypothetical protein
MRRSKKVVKKPEKLGATGRYPLGRLSPEDEGELNIAVFLIKGNVRIEFGKPVAWMSMPAKRAKEFAELIMRHASKLEEIEASKNEP